MFSQLRNAVDALEQLATQQTSPNRKTASGSGSTLFGHVHSGSDDTQRSPVNSIDEGPRSLSVTSPNQLAESARSNLRKSLMLSRSSSPVPQQSQEKAQPRRAVTLEERLRASFVIGEDSERTTREPSTANTPNEVDPASIALPFSPGTSSVTSSQELSLPPLEEAFDPLGAQLSPPLSRSITSPPATASSNIGMDALPVQAAELNTGTDESTLNPLNERGPSSLPSSETTVDDEQPSQMHASEIPASSPPLDSDVVPLGLSLQKEIIESDRQHSSHDTPTQTLLEHHTILATGSTYDSIPDGPPREDVRHEPHTNILDSSASNHRLPEPIIVATDPVSVNAEEPEVDIEKLRQRLEFVEQHFTDVSSSLSHLQEAKRLADQVLKDYTPVETILDVDALRDHFKNINAKAEISAEEIKRLHAAIQQHDVRLEELRDAHRLESSSQSEEIERLRRRVSETESLLKASEEVSARSKTDIERLQTELEKSKMATKEEAEKGTKAISLLKTVRAKSLKAEKEKDDALKEVATFKEKEKEEKEKERQEAARLEGELERIKQDKEREIASLRSQYEKELLAVKERSERENQARRSQLELEVITIKAAHSKELTAKQSRITSLEMSVRTLSEEKDSMFDQLQMRQAELESSQSHLESVEARTRELQYQLREAESRIEIITEELNEMRRNVVNGKSSQSSAEELARILSETEGKYEARISEMRSRMRALEKERQEAEDEWNRNLQERSRELERLRSLVDGKGREYAEAIRTKADMETKIMELQAESRKLRAQKEVEDGVLRELQSDIAQLKDAEVSLKQEREELSRTLQVVEKQIEEGKVRENILKKSNKTLREELRKVQASAALLERQRNPGIGYWSTSPHASSFTQSAVELQSPSQASRSSIDEGSNSSATRPGSPTSIAPVKNEEEVNLEYIRNVILQFLEHKEMRPNLVRVLSIILHFTPQETRRLIAKV